MKKNYVTPQIESIEVEIEDVILSTSGVEDFTDGSILGEEF